jgi:DNA repair exonuclease SbcCD ATPase subunit
MFIKNLKLKNYGAIQEGKLEFQKGFNILSGANGQGKSHIIRALAYLILNHNEGKIEDDLNWNSDTFTISTELEHGDKLFKIKNYYNGKSVSKELELDDKKYDGNKDVVDTLSEYFNPTYSKPALIAFQGEMDVVTATPSQRRESLKNIYDLNFQREIRSLEDEVDSLKNKIQDIEKQIAVFNNKDYTTHKKERPPFSKDVYEQKVQEIEHLQSKLETLKSDIDNYESKLQSINRLEEFVDSKDKEIKQLKTDVDVTTKKILELQSIIDNPDYSTVRDLEKQIDVIKLERIQEEFDTEALEKKKETLYKEQNDMNNLYKEIQLIEKGKCPTCGRDFHDVDIEEYRKRYKEKEFIVNKLDIEVNDLDKKYKEWQKKKRENDRKREQKNNLTNQLNYERKKVEDVVENSKKSLEERKEELEKIKGRITTLLSERDKLEKDAQEEFSNLPNVENIEQKNKQIDTIRSDIKRNQEEIETYTTIVNKNAWIEEENKKILEQKDKDEKLRCQLDKEHDNLLKELSEYEKSVSILKKDFPNYIINTLKSDIENGMNDVLDKAYSGKYHVQIQENRNGLSIMYGNNKEIKLASGAEKNLFTIGFKNAFTKLAGLKVLLLDECDNFMDEDIAKNTFTVVNSLIEQEVLNQVIIITHKDSVKELLEGDYKAKVFEVKEGKVSVLM